MDGKKYKTSIGIISGLTVLSVGLFGYQNFYYGKQQAKDKTSIYVAKSDIQARTKISADMFESVEIAKNSQLDTYVTNLDKFVGKELKGGLLTGEPLTNVRVAEKGSDLEANLSLELQPDYMGDVKANDNVRVYVMLTDKNTGKVEIKVLFDNKKIKNPAQSQDGGSLVNVSTSQPDEKPKMILMVTDAQLQDYYKAKATGKVIVSKISDVDLGKIVSEGAVNPKDNDIDTTKNFDPTSQEAQNSYRPTDNKDNSLAVISYTFKEGDTIDILCQKFKTTKDVISKLNNNTVEFKAGDKVTVPAI